MNDKSVWLGPLGISMVCFMAAGSLMGVGNAGLVLLVLGCLSLCLSVFSAVKAKISKRRDRYDLAALREVHDLISLERDEVGYISNTANAIDCVRCNLTFSSRLPACPRCGQPAGMP